MSKVAKATTASKNGRAVAYPAHPGPDQLPRSVEAIAGPIIELIGTCDGCVELNGAGPYLTAAEATEYLAALASLYDVSRTIYDLIDRAKKRWTDAAVAELAAERAAKDAARAAGRKGGAK